MKTLIRIAVGIALTASLFACDDDDAPPTGTKPPPATDYTYALVEAFPGVTFSDISDIRSAGDGSDRLFVVEQVGRIHAISSAGVKSEFLDITDRVWDAGGQPQEVGLLGLAFHPDFATNGYFYVYYSHQTPTHVSRLSRFTVQGNPDVVDPATELILMEFTQPYGNHNGGGMCFDGDGMLLLSLGDGGAAGDPEGRAQNRTNIFGSVLRLDVDQDSGTPPYGIPADNPFVGNGNNWREEIFAWGLRNPWRISYDAASDRIWAGDVGQSTKEEVDVITSGSNYGWDCREGTDVYTGPPDGPSASCAVVTGLVDPVFDYPRTAGIAVAGGYVYRGPTATSLTGRYIFSDWGSGRIWAMTYDGTSADVVELTDADFGVPTFGVGEDGELYVASSTASTPVNIAGRLWTIEETPIQP